ncbi:glycoside hydrolase family 28 protein [Puteibacter caeruleilacunae]|nr:glycoside hydrolase family 28 protein [Puteibacter caeruleilacunae]
MRRGLMVQLRPQLKPPKVLRLRNNHLIIDMNFKKLHLIAVFTLALFSSSNANAFKSGKEKADWINNVGYKGYEYSTDTFNVKEFGAINTGIFNATNAIQKTINACSQSGGGVVFFPKGMYLSGSIFVKDNVHVLFEEGTIILGSTELADYPERPTRVAGIEIKWPSALININDAKNVKISGKAELQGRGRIFWAKFEYMKPVYQKQGLKWARDYDCKRPRMLVVNNSSNVFIGDVTFKESPFWTVQILYSKSVSVNGVVIRNHSKYYAPSTDGIDIDSSERVLVQNCDVACEDDNFCLKAGRDADGLRVNRPCQYIVIRDNVTAQGSGLIVFGSETSGGIKHVYVSNMKANGTDTGVRFKSARTRGGVIEDILIENVTLTNIPTAFEMLMNWNPTYSYCKLPDQYKDMEIPERWKILLKKVDPPQNGICKMRNIHFKNISVTNSKRAFKVQGYQEYPISNITFENVSVSTKSAGSIENAADWDIIDSSFKFEDGKGPSQKNCTKIDGI